MAGRGLWATLPFEEPTRPPRAPFGRVWNEDDWRSLDDLHPG